MTVFRVEGPGNARIAMGAGGDVTIRGDKMLFLNFGDEVRAQDFLAKRLSQGYTDTLIKRFDVTREYYERLIARAMPESQAKGSSVINVDSSRTSSSYGLRATEFPDLMCAIIPGSGRC